MDPLLNRNALYHYLISLGDIVALEERIDTDLFVEELKQIEERETLWFPYNQRKNDYGRYGLSLTSLDGEVGGIDLDSILEYNLENKTQYDEMSFKSQTRSYRQLTSLKKSLEGLEEFMGRSHLIKFKRGGHFPFHRDSQFLDINTFRLFSVLEGEEELVFLLDGKRVRFQVGEIYFINTRLEHALVNLGDQAIVLVLNIELSRGAVDYIGSHLNVF